MWDNADTTNQQTVFPLNSAQNEGIMHDVERLAASQGACKRSEHGNDSQTKNTSENAK